MNWTDDRTTELTELWDLLNEVSVINKGNCVLERLQKCISLAEKLKTSDIETGRMSFITFLNQQAIKDRVK